MDSSSILKSEAAEPFTLEGDEVHVWYASQKCEASEVNKLLEYLDETERRRAEKFIFKKDCHGFIIARGLLRIILSRYLNLRPEQLRFNYNSYGKPAVDSYGRDIRFNLSHAGDLILYAFSLGREVGVDVEQVKDELDILGVAKSFFSNAEVAMLASLPVDMRRRGFFNCWTRKEAYIKARGRGLSQPLNQFEVSLTPNEPARLLSTAHDALEATRWMLLELPLGDKYVAAIAVEGFDWRAKHYLWKRYKFWPFDVENIGTIFDDCE